MKIVYKKFYETYKLGFEFLFSSMHALKRNENAGNRHVEDMENPEPQQLFFALL